MRTILYLRCSHEESAASGLGLEAQERKGRAYCEASDLGIPKIICDPAFSGKSLDRPGIQRITDLAKHRAFDALVVLRLDRLSRSVKDTLSLVELLNRYGVQLHSVAERLDTGSASGRFVLTILSAMSAMEREVCAERTSLALQSLIVRGQRAGQIPFGFTLAGDGRTLLRNESEQAAIARIRQLHEDGYSYRQICATLTQEGFQPHGLAWHPQTIANVLKRAA